MSTYRDIVRRLKAKGVDSAYLDRLSARVDAEEEEHRLEAEVRAEVASALGRTGAKADLAFLELEVALAELESAPPGPEHDAALLRFRERREAAEAARLDLRIHREAVGIRRNDDLSWRYPLPDRR